MEPGFHYEIATSFRKALQLDEEDDDLQA